MLNPSLPALIRRSDIDALLVHGYNNVSHWLAYSAAIFFKIPYLLRGESRPDRESKYHPRIVAKRALLRPLIQHAAACLAIGDDNRNFYRSYGAQPHQIFFAPYSVDTERFSMAGALGRSRRTVMVRSLGLNPEIPLVLFAAKLQPWKRPLDVVRAMDQLACPANLIIIGDGPLRSDIDNLASGRPWMRVLGFINQSEIAEWYGASDLLVLPSSHEPWGLAINEAMAAGSVPIVSDTVGCATDLVTRDVGWVYPTGNVGAMADAIMGGCQEGALNERRAAAQRRSAEYGIASTARGIEMAVATVLGR
jgi:glycosyltransferase involved in cell wall biosynthesis